MYKTEVQKVVVESRVKQGYSADMLGNGDWLLIKNRHTMVINALGYDVHLPGFTYSLANKA